MNTDNGENRIELLRHIRVFQVFISVYLC